MDMTLANLGIPLRSSRPSRKYLAEPAVRAVLVLCQAGSSPVVSSAVRTELRGALMVVIPDLDVVRADLIVRTLYSDRRPEEGFALSTP